MALHAIITAGGRLPRELCEYSASPIKALLPVGGRTLLEAACRAAVDTGMIERIVVVGGAEVQAATPSGAQYVPEGADVVENLLRGYQALGGEDHNYAVISPDLPFVTGDALAAFLAAAMTNCEIGLPIVSAEDFLARFPGAPNSFVRLDGAGVTLGSCLCLTGHALITNIPLARDIYRLRKYPHRLAVLFGMPIALAFLSGRTTLAALEARAGRLTGVRVRGLRSQNAVLAYDIDNRVDYAYAVQHLQGG